MSEITQYNQQYTFIHSALRPINKAGDGKSNQQEGETNHEKNIHGYHARSANLARHGIRS